MIFAKPITFEIGKLTAETLKFSTDRTRDGIIFCNAIDWKAESGKLKAERLVANAINFGDDLPFSEARLLLEIKSLLPTNLTSSELREIPAEILERALFSARVASAEMLQAIADELQSYFNGEENLATARLNLKNMADELQIDTMLSEEERGSVMDLGSDARLNLMLNTNAATARGYGQFMQGQKSLDAAPAWELYRAFSRKVPRNWIQRFQQVGGKLRKGKLAALKNDPIWDRLGSPSHFDDAIGNPYPPFAFNSGMRWKSVGRREAMELGLIDRDTQIEPQTRGFNEDFQASPDVRDRALRSVLEEEGYSFKEGVLTL